MISRRLITVFAISIPLFILHGIEEFLTGFHDVDSWGYFIFQPFIALPIHDATFLIFQVMFWILLIVSLALLLGERWRFCVLGLAGIIYILEFHHLYKALLAGGYYPGLLTALFFPIIAVFFWQEWFKVRKHMTPRKRPTS